MQVPVTPRHYLGAAAILVVVAALMAGMVVLSADWISVKGVTFAPVFIVVLALHLPPSLKRMAETMAAGRQGRERLLEIRQEYLAAVGTTPSLRAWPESTLSCLLAACAVLLRAALRSWVVLVIAVGLLRAMGSEFKGDLGVFWTVFMAVETVLVGARAYLRGTLPLTGMGFTEMEAYFRAQIDRSKDGYLIRDP